MIEIFTPETSTLEPQATDNRTQPLIPESFLAAGPVLEEGQLDSLPDYLNNAEAGDILPELDILDIMKFIPHRYPFLLVDRVTEHVRGQHIKGYKNLTMNEFFFQGHFPERPIMPGVLQLEALAQLGGVLIAHMPQGHGKLAVFAGIDKVRFRRMVIPGDRLDLCCELTRFRLPIGKSCCVASVNGEVTVEAELMFSLVN